MPTPSELGLRQPSVISCDNLVTVAKHALDDRPIGILDMLTMRAVDAALIHALGIQAA